MSPPTDLKSVVDSEIKYASPFIRVAVLTDLDLLNTIQGMASSYGIVNLNIYFHQRNADEHHAALELRDAVLRLRRDGAFVAVPLFRVNTDPIGPHPVERIIYNSDG
ncbi:hypothetical protein QCA50_007584 [Cerrena zonata]|uniref:Uncharacterized protein n=1 Tax=Cerrena zonata TaxID=2478898 RepID=A0AAW0GFK1_9APHY